MKITTKPKIWGNSLGFIIPKDFANKEGITTETEVTIEIKKENPVKEVFGVLKAWKIDSQKMKDELRKDEEESWSRKWKK